MDPDTNLDLLLLLLLAYFYKPPQVDISDFRRYLDTSVLVDTSVLEPR